MAIVTLRESGVPAADPRIQRGSARRWTRSLNTDRHYFIMYSGKALPLLALSLCDALPADVADKEK
jgi:hypothetical protein